MSIVPYVIARLLERPQKPAAWCAMEPPAATEELRHLAGQVAQAVQVRFQSLAKNGKPQAHEHTVLAGIVAYCAACASQEAVLRHENYAECCQPHCSRDSDAALSAGSRCRIHVVAIGTGTKCLGGKLRSAAGDVLNDSHAEVIARRAFLAWVYQQLMIAAEWSFKNPQMQVGQQPALSEQDKQQMVGSCTSAFYWCSRSSSFKLQAGIRFAIYISQPPCGDAAIYEHPCQQCEPTVTQAELCQQVHEQQQLQQQKHVSSCSRQTPTPVGTGKTGAKLIRLTGATDVSQAAAPSLHDKQDVAVHQPCKQQEQLMPCVPGAYDVETGPQAPGALRRKPGRGDPTLSLSCSDKIARWACLGLQGCLLSAHLANPLYLDLLVVGTSIPPATTETGSQANQQAHSNIGLSTASTPPDQSIPLLCAVEAAGVRAFNQRLTSCGGLLQPPFAVHPPVVVAVPATTCDLGMYPSNERRVPAGSSINWNCQLPMLSALIAPPSSHSVAAAAGMHEATLASNGRKLGAAKKSVLNASKTSSRLCSAAMYARWRAISDAASQLQSQAACSQPSISIQSCGQSAGDDSEFDVSAYRRLKSQTGREYQESWSTLRSSPCVFRNWLMKW